MAVRRFRRFNLAKYREYLKSYVNKVKFSEVHVHHTWKPTKADYRNKADKESLIYAMWRYHTETRGWSDIAQHISIDPDGFIWEGRSLLSPPASSTGYNDSDDDGVHPFMFEMIGNFDAGQEKLEGAQLDTVLGVVVTLQDIWGLTDQHIRFHREMQSGKSCPGTGLEKSWFLGKVQEVRRQGFISEKQDKQDVTLQASSYPVIQETVNILINDKPKLEGYLIDGATYVPLRIIAEQLDAEVDWDPRTRTATISKGGV